MSVCAVDSSTGQTLQVIIVEDISLVVVCVAASAWASGQIATAVFSVQGGLVGVYGGEIIASIDGAGRVGDEMIAQLSKGAFHGRGLS